MRDFRIYDRALSAAEVHDLGYGSDVDRVQTDAAALDLGDTSAVTADLSLKTTGGNGSAIAWSSTNPALVSTNGKVTRPVHGAGNASATLTATISKGTVSATRQFAVTVLQQVSDQDKVSQAAQALTVTDESDVRGNLTLPTTGLNGATITWRSSKPAVITATGEVTRPATGSRPAHLTLVATVTVGSATTARTFRPVVAPLPTAEPMQGYSFAYFTGEGTADGEQIHFA